jgi:hypothetical protein
MSKRFDNNPLICDLWNTLYAFRTYWIVKLTDASDIFQVNSLFHILLINLTEVTNTSLPSLSSEKSYTLIGVTLLSTSSILIMSWTDPTFEWSFMLWLIPIKFYFWTMPHITRSNNNDHVVLHVRSFLRGSSSHIASLTLGSFSEAMPADKVGELGHNFILTIAKTDSTSSVI